MRYLHFIVDEKRVLLMHGPENKLLSGSLHLVSTSSSFFLKLFLFFLLYCNVLYIC